MISPRAAKPLAWVWLLLVLLGALYLGVSWQRGILFRTDFLSLLPAEARGGESVDLEQRLLDKAARRFVLLVGHPDRKLARQAADNIEAGLMGSGLAAIEPLGADRIKGLGAFYLPRTGLLLSAGDRAALTEGEGAALARRALAQVFGVGGIADARLLARDPFLLMPQFLAALPAPLSRLAPDEGRLSVREGGVTWVLVSGEVTGDPYALDVQKRFVGALDGHFDALVQELPDLKLYRTGAIFFAAEGSASGLRETSTLGTMATVGTILLLVGAFRRAGPLLINLLAVAVGIGAGLAANLLMFGDIHIATLLFGVGLTGVAVDYGIHYCATVFDPARPDPWTRLRKVLPGISIGLLTTLIGYAIMLLAPFPALRQVAIFSIVGLTASFFTVVFWFPYLDRGVAPRYAARMLQVADLFSHVWEDGRLRRLCWVSLALLLILGAVGFSRAVVDDDVRRMQSLSPTLLADQAAIAQLAGSSAAPQFVAIEAADDEAALRQGERVGAILDRLVGEGALAAHRGPADFVPSLARQRENAELTSKLDVTAQAVALGLKLPPAASPQPFTLAEARASGAFPFLDEWLLGPGSQVIALDGLKDPAALRAALSGMEGVRFLDPAGDFSARLGAYRHKALWLIGMSALLMILPLGWRYGLKGGIVVLLPPLAALLLAPALIALTGEGLSFFHVMGLILVLAIGVDYATFCAEADRAHRPVTMLAVLLDMVTTLLSFGLLAFSSVFAVHAFGLTMLIGILVAFLLAPLAGNVNPRGAKS
ncbi:MMPL family transporter [Dongia sp.]|uniref:MMPL family transporter n=1 Tax=Dongia sp. TaxID=1977262 RepID=UPI0035B4E762